MVFVSKTEAKSSVFSEPGSSTPSTPARIRSTAATWPNVDGVEDHQLLLDPERERRALAEALLEHV